jgi:hypothetical protein
MPAKRIIKILGREKKVSKAGKDYVLTTLLIEDGTEVTTIDGFDEGDLVYLWYDEQYQRIKVKRA